MPPSPARFKFQFRLSRLREQRVNKTRVGWILALAGILALNVSGTRLLRRHGGAIRYVRVSSLQKLSVPPVEAVPAIRAELGEAARRESGTDYDRAVRVLGWVVHKVKRVDSVPLMPPAQTFAHVSGGGGTLCGGMSILFSSGLSAAGVPSRIVGVQRNLYDGYDTHVTVEALIGGKWVLMDPTFNCSYKNAKGELLSAQEVHEALLAGRRAEVTPAPYPRGEYPAGNQPYATDVIQLYNNVFVEEGNSSWPWYSRIPVLQYWTGPKAYYEVGAGESASHLVFADQLYFVSMAFTGFTGAAWTLSLVHLYRGRKRVPTPQFRGMLEWMREFRSRAPAGGPRPAAAAPRAGGGRRPEDEG